MIGPNCFFFSSEDIGLARDDGPTRALTTVPRFTERYENLDSAAAKKGQYRPNERNNVDFHFLYSSFSLFLSLNLFSVKINVEDAIVIIAPDRHWSATQSSRMRCLTI